MMQEQKYTFADRLKQVMEERDIKQVDIYNLCQPFCKKFGLRIGRNDISQYVTGKASPKQEKLSLIAMALDLNEVWLMGYEGVVKKRSDLRYESDHLSNPEYAMLCKYRALDPANREVVDTVLDMAYEYSQNHK